MILKRFQVNKEDDVVWGKTMENVNKHRHINLVTTEGRKNYLVTEINYRTVKKNFR